MLERIVIDEDECQYWSNKPEKYEGLSYEELCEQMEEIPFYALTNMSDREHAEHVEIRKLTTILLYTGYDKNGEYKVFRESDIGIYEEDGEVLYFSNDYGYLVVYDFGDWSIEISFAKGDDDYENLAAKNMYISFHICAGDRKCILDSGLHSLLFTDIEEKSTSNIVERVLLNRDLIMEAAYYGHQSCVEEVHHPCLYNDNKCITSCMGLCDCKCNHIGCNTLDYARLDLQVEKRLSDIVRQLLEGSLIKERSRVKRA